MPLAIAEIAADVTPNVAIVSLVDLCHLSAIQRALDCRPCFKQRERRDLDHRTGQHMPARVQ
jgi:hypothetical protein